ncbi:uncharacterized protein Tco025E_06948 [Trypanosoma conorhini]|uniref:Uncharacterized protein n=1 Tax=Trypanosoma conorhini TaxID=83891 RepID=A0A422NVY8_9TRYP|nr:uncharacterized protein Tco025E_06948 [Trypanosoma conorhini]RNF09653.1 hypothetical protein Tco025E_06948 [Trypanosoma conorhini]
MGAAASSGRQISRVASAPPHDRSQAMLLVNGSVRRAARGKVNRPLSHGDIGVDLGAMHKIDQRRKKTGTASGAGIQDTSKEADPATLHILSAVKEVDALPDDKASLKLQLLRGCYPFLAQVPTHRFDHLAVLVYQKEGDVYFGQGDGEGAKTTYSRAIQIAETRVARGEKEIYMVLKRYVLAMVGMARLWYAQERETTGFTFADKGLPTMISREDSTSSFSSYESSVLSDTSMFSLNQEILKSMAPKSPRRRAGPSVNVVRLLRPATMKMNFTAEDDFVLRSKMTRELKASPCELLLLRCIEVVEIGHRRQSELLIPALIELAQIYEDLRLYNRSLLLVRRCLGILSVVYDYDHPWIIQLRRRADFLMKAVEEETKETMATKIQATWKMYKAMRLLEEALGRPVTRHVWSPATYHSQANDRDFLKDFVNDLPEGTVLYGSGEVPGVFDTGGVADEEHGADGGRRSVSDGSSSPAAPRGEEGRGLSPESRMERPPSSLRRSTRVMEGSSPPLPGAEGPHEEFPVAAEYPPMHAEGRTPVNTTFIPNGRVVNTAQETQTDTHLQHTAYGGVLTVRTTTVTRTTTEREVGSDEEDSVDEEEEYVAAHDASEAEGGVRSPSGRILEFDPSKRNAYTAASSSKRRGVGDSDARGKIRVSVTSPLPRTSRHGNDHVSSAFATATDGASSGHVRNGAVRNPEPTIPSDAPMSRSPSVQEEGRHRMRSLRAQHGE